MPTSAVGGRGEIIALKGLDLEVHEGEFFGLLGPNGAGKTTTIGILTTRVKPTSGSALVGGANVGSDAVRVRQRIGVVPQRPNPDRSLNVLENLLFHAAYFGIPTAASLPRANALLEQLAIGDKAHSKVDEMSGGQQQRLMIARALIHEPQVIFLDEPTVGLDPQTRLSLWDILRELHREGRTIVMTTHYMEEADALCNRLAIIDHGKVIAVDTPAGLKGSIPGAFVLRLRFAKHTPGLLLGLQSLSGVREVRSQDTTGADVYADRGGSLIPEIASLASTTGAELMDVHISEPSLENLFLHHTGRSLRD